MGGACGPDEKAGTAPDIIENAGDLLKGYDVLFCDVWGVVHNGVRAFGDACQALIQFRKRGGTVVLVSNAPVPGEGVAALAASLGVPRAAWDGIVTSGTIAIEHIGQQNYQRIYAIGPQLRDRAFFDRVNLPQTDIETAQALVCTGLNDEFSETAESYRELLEAALQRSLPFVCANPDIVVDVGGTLRLCAGAIAELYEQMGGDVFWAGKPHASTYDSALLLAADLRRNNVFRSQVLAIGDSLRTDIAGANAAGIDALFIATGIHRDDVTTQGGLAAERVAKLFHSSGAQALGAMPALRW